MTHEGRTIRGSIGTIAVLLAILGSVMVPAAVTITAMSGDNSDQPPKESAPSTSSSIDVIVTGATAADRSTIDRSVERLGGRVTRRLDLVHGLAATVPADAIAALAGTPGVATITPNRRMAAHALLDGTDIGQRELTTVHTAAVMTGATNFYASNVTGRRVGVAIVDTGVDRVKGLDTPGQVIDGPDLSLDAGDPARRSRDGFGHGTHLAGIVAGRDPGHYNFGDNQAGFVGIAPEAHIVNVKVGDRNGVADVSQVIAAIDWVIQHRDTNRLNIKVLLLAYGTDSLQSYRNDPLTAAVELAWRRGITVIVAAGNEGMAFGRPRGLVSPATDPYVLAVGTVDHRGTDWRHDDTVASFSSTGNYTTDEAGRGPDVLAPGISIPSLRVPGSTLDQRYPAARSGTRFFRGTGTSQSAAVTAGLVALLVDRWGPVDPDFIKATLRDRAHLLMYESTFKQGAGFVDIGDPYEQIAAGGQYFPGARGDGSIDAARGTRRAVLDGVEIRGEIDVFGQPFDVAKHTASAAGSWYGSTWSGSTWSGSTWSTGTWSGSTWSGSTWSGSTWSGSTWSGSTWSGSTWSGSTWSGSTWSGSTWSGSTWSTYQWG